MNAHKFQPETTNRGCCFADCSCGWSGGVYDSRVNARAAHAEHKEGKPITEVGKQRPQFMVGPRPTGMG